MALPSTVTASSASVGWTSVLIDCHRVEPQDEAFETHPTPDHTLVVMTRGEQRLDVLKGGTWQGVAYRTGTIGLTPPDDTVRLRRFVRANPRAFEKANLYVPQAFLHDAAELYGRAGQPRRAPAFRHSVLDDPLIAQTVFALVRAMNAGASDLYAQSAMHWLAVHLLSVNGVTGDVRDDGRCPGFLTDRRLGRVVDYMHAHLGDDLTLERLAGEAGISKFHFARLFREATGTTPHAFLVRLRLDAGMLLLRTSDLAVKEIAARCGFLRVSHFGTAFAKHTGLSPTAFRRRAHG